MPLPPHAPPTGRKTEIDTDEFFLQGEDLAQQRDTLRSEAPVTVSLSPALTARRAQLRKIVIAVVGVASAASLATLLRLLWVEPTSDAAQVLEGDRALIAAAALPSPVEPEPIVEPPPAPAPAPAPAPVIERSEVEPAPTAKARVAKRPRAPTSAKIPARVIPPASTPTRSTVAVDPLPEGYRPPTARFTD